MVVEKAQGAQIEEQFIQQMKLLREVQRISQVELAARMVNAGWDYWRQTTVSRVEKFERIVRLGEAHDIAQILGISLAGMLALDKEAQNQNIRAEVLRRDLDDWVGRLNGSVASFMEQLEQFQTTLNQAGNQQLAAAEVLNIAPAADSGPSDGGEVLYGFGSEA
ncbi:hypothetical protein DQ354_12335 [Arthrobacter sp. AQ5-06]|nr:hypothetical protein DQ354_12335 [Arthrobacter sp. AQ5-06]